MPNHQSIIPPLSEQDIQRFWSKVAIADPEECWLWQDWCWKDRKGNKTYGGFWLKGKDYPAHRIAHFLAKGFNSDRIFSCHHCDNPPCVNPNHLFEGTPDDNMQDMIRKGRAVVAKIPPEKIRRGSANNKAILTEILVTQMLKDRDLGMSTTEAGQKYGVTRCTTLKIFKGLLWKHVYYPLP